MGLDLNFQEPVPSVITRVYSRGPPANSKTPEAIGLSSGELLLLGYKLKGRKI